MGKRLKAMDHYSDTSDALRSVMIELYTATRKGDSQSIKALSRRAEELINSPDFDPNARDAGNNTLIMEASSFVLPDIVGQLIRKGADVGAKNAEGKDALAHLDEVGYVAFALPNSNSLQRRYSYTRRLLKGAMEQARVDNTVKYRLAFKANKPNAVNQNSSPVHFRQAVMR